MARHDITKYQFSASDSRASNAGKKGGVKSGQKRREKRKLRELAEELLQLPVSSGKIDKIDSLCDGENANISVGQAILVPMAKAAIEGDKGAAEFVRDTAGQKPTLDVNVQPEETLKIVIDYGDNQDTSE